MCHRGSGYDIGGIQKKDEQMLYDSPMADLHSMLELSANLGSHARGRAEDSLS